LGYVARPCLKREGERESEREREREENVQTKTSPKFCKSILYLSTIDIM
jgi:hypothetical protein